FHRPTSAISAEVRAALEAFPWPGNIRQLENVLQQAVLLSTSPELRPSDLPPAIQEHAARALGTPPERDSLASNRDAHERKLIHQVLVECNYNCVAAARKLNVSRTTLYKKMKKFGWLKRVRVGRRRSNSRNPAPTARSGAPPLPQPPVAGSLEPPAR